MLQDRLLETPYPFRCSRRGLVFITYRRKRNYTCFRMYRSGAGDSLSYSEYCVIWRNLRVIHYFTTLQGNRFEKLDVFLGHVSSWYDIHRIGGCLWKIES